MNWTRIGRDKTPAGIARYLIRGGIVYIWCDGTQSPREWRWNFTPGTVRVGDRRYNCKDWEQALAVMEALPDEVRYHDCFFLAGLSRGGAIAQCLGEMLGTRYLTLFASKRAGRKLPRRVCHAYRGDIVPYLPPWYTGFDMAWLGNWQPFWKAHEDALKLAAKWRYEIARLDSSGE